MYFGVDPAVVLNIEQGLQQNAPVESRPIQADDPMAKFVAKVLGSTEDTWDKFFSASGEQYQAHKLVPFTGQIQTLCGADHTAIGPLLLSSRSKSLYRFKFLPRDENTF